MSQKFSKKLSFLFTILIFALSWFFYSTILANTENSDLQVNYSVPGVCGNGIKDWNENCDTGVNRGACPQSCSLSCTINDCGGTGCTGDCTNPEVKSINISNVSTSSAVISWQATDNVGVANVTLKYGTVYGTYNLSASSVNNNASTTLTGLSPSTEYYFEITATDSSGNKGYDYDHFHTSVIGTDNTAPNIYNINVSTGTSAITISFYTTEPATSNIFYGTTTARNLTATGSNSFQTQHSVTLDVLPNTTYHYVITAADSSGNSTTTLDSTFTTLKDKNPPDNVSNFQLTTTAGTNNAIIHLTWANPDSQTMPDFYKVKILRRTGSYPSSYNDSSAVKVYDDSGTFYNDNVSFSTHYFYTAYAYDTSFNTSSGAQEEITSASRVYTPQEVTNYYISTSTGVIILNWTNPTAQAMPNFQSVKILRKIGSAPTNYNDNTSQPIYTGNSSYFEDRNSLELDKDYYYKIFTFDGTSYSSGVLLNIIYTQPSRVEICNNNLDDDGNGLVDCADQVCANLSACLEVSCSNGIDDDRDNLIDCLDILDCSNDPACRTTPPEDCHNKIDDDFDGAIDCSDSDCTRVCQQCVGDGCGGGSTAQCSDGIDNDGDGLIDYPADQGCTAPEDNDEYNPPPITTSTISLTDLIFSTGNGQLILTPQNNTVSGLSNFPLNISLPVKKVKTDFKSLVLKVNGGQYALVKNSAGNLYYTGIAFPSGNAEAYLEISYVDGSFDYARFALSGVAWGQVKDDQGKTLSGINLTLQNGAGQTVNLVTYGQVNPVATNGSGLYGWMVPNGDYQILASADGYYERTIGVFNVNNNLVNKVIELIPIPKKLEEIIDPEASLGENILNVGENLLEKTRALTKLTTLGLQNSADNPQLEKVTQDVVAPSAIGVVAISALPFLNVGNLLALLRLLFLQPLLLIGRRKRVKWGQVYNSLNKLPVDLAIVRLVNVVTNKIVQTQVTDIKGRYAFIVAMAGRYRIEVQKSDFIFPSVLLKGFQVDGQKMDLYHGEIIEVSEAGAIITANIPLDSGQDLSRPKRLVWEKAGRITQRILSPVGFLVTVVSCFITPTLFIKILLVTHILFFFLVRRLGRPVRLKGWGIVYDPQNNQPVKRAIARLFNLQLNKLVSTQVTDNQGRYYFLAGNGKYSITVEHDGYYTAHTPVIDLEGEDADVIEEKIALQHKNDSLNLELNIPSTTALATKENTPGIGDNNFIKPPENIIENTPPNSDNSVPKPPEKEDKLG